MSTSPVMTDEFNAMEERLQRLTKVLTTKALIAQTPKEVVWTLNKAKLYHYTPVVPKEQRHPVPLLLVFALMNRPYILDLRPGHSFVEFMVGKVTMCTCWTGAHPGRKTRDLISAITPLSTCPALSAR